MENSTLTLLKLFSTNKILNKLTSKSEQKNIISNLFNLPFFTQIIADIGHEIFKNVLSSMTIKSLLTKEEMNSNDDMLYFLLKGETFSQSKSFKEYSQNVDGPLNFANRNQSTITSNKSNITSINFIAVSDSVFLLVDINSILNAKDIANGLNVNEIKQIEVLNRYLTRLQCEKINKYFIRHTYCKNEKVYTEGQRACDIYFILKGEFVLTKKRRIEKDYQKKLDFVNNELKLLSRQSDLYNFCLSGDLPLNAKSVVKISKQIEEDKSSLLIKGDDIEINEDVVNLVVIRDNNVFGEIEMFKQVKHRTHSVICLTENAQVLSINYNYFKSLCPKEMINELEQGALTKAKVMSEQFHFDCDTIDNEKRDKMKVPIPSNATSVGVNGNGNDNNNEQYKMKKQYSFIKKLNRNENDSRNNNVNNNMLKTKNTFFNLKKLPTLYHNNNNNSNNKRNNFNLNFHSNNCYNSTTKKFNNSGFNNKIPNQFSFAALPSTALSSDNNTLCNYKRSESVPKKINIIKDKDNYGRNSRSLLNDDTDRIELKTKSKTIDYNDDTVQLKEENEKEFKNEKVQCGKTIGAVTTRDQDKKFTLSQPKNIIQKIIQYNHFTIKNEFKNELLKKSLYMGIKLPKILLPNKKKMIFNYQNNNSMKNLLMNTNSKMLELLIEK